MTAASRSPRFTTLMFGAAFIYLVALLFHLPALFFMASALVVAPMVSYLMASAGLRSVTAERRLPSRLWPDERTDVELRIENHAWLPKCLLLIDEDLPDGLEGDAADPPGCVVPMLWSEPFVYHYPLTARHRGRYRLQPLVATAIDTFDLFHARRVVGPTDEVLVYPRTVPLKHHALHSPSLRGQLRRSSPLAEGTDFRATREYRPGDDLRRVHWRSTARRGRLIVAEYEDPATADLFIVLDVSAGSAVGEGKDTTLETGVTLAASVIEHELERANAVGLLVDGAERVRIGMTRERHECLRFFEALALAEADGPASFAATLEAAAGELPPNAELLLITASCDPLVVGAVRRLVQRNHGVAVAWLDPRGYPGVTPDDAGQGRLLELKRAGATVFRVRRGDVARGLSEPI